MISIKLLGVVEMEKKEEFKIGERVILHTFDVKNVKLPKIVTLNNIYYGYGGYDFEYESGDNETYRIGVRKEWIAKLSPVTKALYDIEE